MANIVFKPLYFDDSLFAIPFVYINKVNNVYSILRIMTWQSLPFFSFLVANNIWGHIQFAMQLNTYILEWDILQMTNGINIQDIEYFSILFLIFSVISSIGGVYLQQL